MRYYYFGIQMSYEQCSAFYKGRTPSIQVTDITGRTIRFPAAKILPFMSQIGIRGQFRLTLDDNNKFVSLERI
ncbi:DUF2835 domain-containing protein [Pseudoalteromonas sp. SSDWG2]|uniref:DUF2835 domain-containing protein n=1 Tax=Pseudoalteromonas sp. SSDWG2 TaxID=3139391 RepID=UPI003BA8A56A